MDRFSLDETTIGAVNILTRKPLSDGRGFFERMFCVEELSQLSFKLNQINRSFTTEKGSMRGMHFQYAPSAETKIVSCLRGSVFDVALDLRAGSPTFLKWHGEILSADNHKSLVIPKGVAHGFQTLEADCELLYLHDAPYNKDAEGHVHLFDEQINIQWPLAVNVLSKRDENAPMLSKDFIGIKI